jgi:hypothetical protein
VGEVVSGLDGSPQQGRHEARSPWPAEGPQTREELSAKYLDMINEGIKNLDKALELDVEYDDAMAYMNLLIRERADLAETTGRSRRRHRCGGQLDAEGSGNPQDQGGAPAREHRHHDRRIAVLHGYCAK